MYYIALYHRLNHTMGSV